MEAISRDLQTQMLKVLSTRRLMHVPIQEFDKVMLVYKRVVKECHLWDEAHTVGSNLGYGFVVESIGKCENTYLVIVEGVNSFQQISQNINFLMQKYVL